MKLQGARIESFVKAPDPDIRAVLIYGPDSGLVRERATLLTKAIVEDPLDPFLVVEFTGAALRSDPALLADEAAAIALMGGRRVVRFRDVPDSLAGVFKIFLEDLPGDALVLVQSGDLGPRTALRKLFEGDKAAAALPCYADDERTLDYVIRDTLNEDNLAVTPEASAYLAANLGTDRGQTRSELRKLAIYMGDETRVELDDAMACVGDSSAFTLDALVFAAADGDVAAVDHALTRSFQEGANPVSILRATARHLMRLQLVRAGVDKGKRIEDAMKTLRPPVFFKMTGSFRRQAGLWRATAIARALRLTLEAEIQCKTTGMPDQAICGRTLLQIGRLASAGARARQ
ncbi:MAG: DNA polymerase-3 subunit delta [Alphaproteobacteria bacterium]